MLRIKLNDGLEISRLVCDLESVFELHANDLADVDRQLEALVSSGLTAFTITSDLVESIGPNLGLLKTFQKYRHDVQLISVYGSAGSRHHQSTRSNRIFRISDSNIRAELEKFLKSVGTQFSDLLVVSGPDPLLDHKEAGQFLDQLIGEQRVKATGVASFSFPDYQRLQQPMFNRLAVASIDLDLPDVSALGGQDLPGFLQNDLAILVDCSKPNQEYPPRLTECLEALAIQQSTTADSIELAFLLKHPGTLVPIIGARHLRDPDQLSLVERLKISDEDWYDIYQSCFAELVSCPKILLPRTFDSQYGL